MRLFPRPPAVDPRWLALAAAVLVWLPLAARATTTVRVEWTRDSVVYGAQTLTATSSSVASSASPSCGGLGCKARITVLSGSAVVVWGAPTPVATQTNGYRQDVGQIPPLPTLNAGDMVAVIEATDAPASGHVFCDGGCGSPPSWSTIPQHSSPITVTSSATQLVSAVAARGQLSVQNEGAVDMRCSGVNTLTFAGGGSTTGGFLVKASGGAYTLINYIGALWCIVSSTSGTADVVETTP